MYIQLHSQVFGSRFIVNQKPMSEGQENTAENRHYNQARDVKEGKADTGGRRIDHAQAIVIFRSPYAKEQTNGCANKSSSFGETDTSVVCIHTDRTAIPSLHGGQ